MEMVLERLFESQPKVRILRLFLRNPSTPRSIDDVMRLAGIPRRVAEKEVVKLRRIGLLEPKNANIVISEIKGKGKGKKLKMITKSVRVDTINPSFEFLRELRDLILRQVPESRHKLISKLKKLGRVRLAIAAGAFINSDSYRVDLLIVGDNIQRKRIERLLQQWEANSGRELSYALMSTEEFRYRQDMFDRFTRDVLELPHDKVINLIQIP